MNEKEIKAKLEQVFEGLVMTEYQRNTIKEIILLASQQSAKATSSGNTISKITPLEEEAEITDVIGVVNQIINAFK